MKLKEEMKTKAQGPTLKEVSDRKASGIRDRLTITVREIAPEQRWILHGRLTDYSVAEVLSNWYASKGQESVGRRVVDLDGVSVIDRSGERVLSMMIQDGARFGGMYARHLLVALQERALPNTQLN
jgi:CubicO group peptidase (beta-lactamase class C family)